MQLSGMRPTFSRIAILVALALVTIGLAARDVSAAPTPSREMTFIEQETGLALILQVEPFARNPGAFVFRVPGRGLYEGSVGTAMRVVSPQSIVIDFTGPAVLRPPVDPGQPVAAQRAVPVTVRLQAQVDPSHREAEAKLRDGESSFQLNTHRRAGQGIPADTLRAFETALVASDWTSLYALSNRDLRSAYTAQTFASQAEAEALRVGRVLSVGRLSVSDVLSDDSGARWVVVGYSVRTRAPSGVITETRYDAFFIAELRDWKVWYTVAR